MKIQRRILVLLAMLIAVFSMALFFLMHFERGRLELIKIQQMEEKKDIFAQIIRVRGSSVNGMVQDYSLWDEMVDFVATGDKDWATSNVDTSLESFHADAMWIYNPENQLVHFLKSFEHPDFVEISKVLPNISDIFHGQPFVYFFVNTDVGIMDIYGATINYVADVRREKSYGYLLVGRIWDQNFIDDLAAITGTQIEIVPEGGEPVVQDHDGDIGNISFTYVLEGLDQKPVARLLVSFHSNMISRADAISRSVSLLSFIFLATLFLFVALALVFWISWPLRKISLALAQEDARHIKALENNRSEMGDIARMIKQFFLQKQNLSKEIQERKIAEKHLEDAYKDLQSIQAQLIQVEKMSSIGQLSAGVAHEINNPVGFIGSNMEVLREYIENYARILKVVEQIMCRADGGDWENVKAGVDQLRRLEQEINLDFMKGDVSRLLEQSMGGLERIRKIVADLRTFAREDHVENRESAKVEHIIDDILGMVQSEFQSRAELIKDYGDTPAIPCYSQKLGQVFINLLINAIQAIREKGRVIIRTYRRDDFVCVDISDNGEGIAGEHLTKIFDPFFTTKPVGKGTGLGLSVSYEIIKKHGGEILVKSEVGRGTTFTVMLPLD